MGSEVLILSSGRCSWGRCIFCGYGKITGYKPTTDKLREVFDSYFKSLKKETTEIKVYGSGSFLDEKQIPAKARRHFISSCKKHGIKELTYESRPEFITKEKLAEFKDLKISVALGLEVASNDRLEHIQKGFKLKDYEKTAQTIHAAGGKVRTYLLANIPSTPNLKQELDESIRYALPWSDSIVVINLLPHGDAGLMRLWLTGEWTFLSRLEFRKLVEKWADNPKIEFDEETFKFTPKISPTLQENLSGVGEAYLIHPHFEVWQDWLLRWYLPPKNKNILLFLPCSYKKPYTESETHRKIIEVLDETPARNSIHEVMLSNAGVVPREFENRYPFNAYDWDEKEETTEIKKRYIEVTRERIKKYLKAHRLKYPQILCYLKHDSESYTALKGACESLKIEFTNLLNEKTYKKVKHKPGPLRSDEALTDLKTNLDESATL